MRYDMGRIIDTDHVEVVERSGSTKGRAAIKNGLFLGEGRG
jgi:hypothetical protein